MCHTIALPMPSIVSLPFRVTKRATWLLSSVTCASRGSSTAEPKLWVLQRRQLQLIFLAYTRSISEDSAEDAMEMSLDEFHDFVVDVGLETKQYKFDVMTTQFIKANATNIAQVREQRKQAALKAAEDA